MTADVVERALIAAHDDRTNAFVSIDDDARPRGDVAPSARLADIPIAIKDLIDRRGEVTTAGSAFYRHTAETTAPCIDRLEAAGAVVIGRTGLHEFAFGFSSENPWFGPVLNPWDHRLSPGGSSGGSAAAVASGVVPVAIGTDTGGSVRVPAALCGLAALKVTHGLIPLDGVFPLVPSLDTVGAIASDLGLLETITAVMAGPHWPSDPGPDPLQTTLLVPERWIDLAPMTDGVRRGFEDFLVAATEAGWEVRRRQLPKLGSSSLQTSLIGPEVAQIHRGWRQAGRPYGDDVGERVDQAMGVTQGEAAEGRRWSDALSRAMGSATAGNTVVLTPTVGALDKTIGDDMIDGVHYRLPLSCFTAPVNATGHPALSVPVAGPRRTPSVQLIGPRHGEAQLMTLARSLRSKGLIDPGTLPSASV